MESRGAKISYHLEERPELRDMFSQINAFQIWAAMMSSARHEPFSHTIRDGLKKV